jgi:hypothetical protein
LVQGRTLSTGEYVLELNWVPSRLVEVQATTNLTDWMTVHTGTTDGAGTLMFQDTNAPLFYPCRFYRVVEVSVP